MLYLALQGQQYFLRCLCRFIKVLYVHIARFFLLKTNLCIMWQVCVSLSFIMAYIVGLVSSLAILMDSLNYRGLTAFFKIDIYHDFINN